MANWSDFEAMYGGSSAKEHGVLPEGTYTVKIDAVPMSGMNDKLREPVPCVKMKLVVAEGPFEGRVFFLDWMGARPESFGMLKSMMAALGLPTDGTLEAAMEAIRGTLDWVIVVSKKNRVSGDKTYENVFVKKVVSKPNPSGYADAFKDEVPPATHANKPPIGGTPF